MRRECLKLILVICNIIMARKGGVESLMKCSVKLRYWTCCVGLGWLGLRAENPSAADVVCSNVCGVSVMLCTVVVMISFNIVLAIMCKWMICGRERERERESEFVLSKTSSL